MRLFLMILLVAAAPAAAPPRRVVSVGGAVTETVYALGAGDRLVAADAGSTYPKEAESLPKIGSHRGLSAEGILSLDPDLLLVTDEAGPAAVLRQVRAAGVRVVELPNGHTLAGAAVKVRAAADALGVADRGEALVRRIEAAPPPAEAGGPTVLFVYARGPSTLLVSGGGTAADAMIRLAGGTNAASGFEGYKPLTAEAAVAAAPQVILVTTSGLESVGGAAGLLDLPGLALTPAGKARRVVAMDDLCLLGFGPRVGDAVAELAGKLRDQPNASPQRSEIDGTGWETYGVIGCVALASLAAVLAVRSRRRAHEHA